VKQLGLEQTVAAEVKATCYLDHPNITKVYGCFWDDKFVYTVGEYAVEKSLAAHLRKHPKGSLAPIVRQVALAVQELAAHSIVHNEINCNDVILTFVNNTLLRTTWSN
jgi:aurora kinase, other